MAQLPTQPAPQTDRVLRAMTDDGAFRVMTIRSTQTVRDCMRAQQCTGIPAAQLGEVLTAAILVRETMAPPHRVQLLLRDRAGNQIVGDAFPEGRTRGLVRVQDDVLGVDLGPGGMLHVNRALPGRAPHQGIIETAPTHSIDGSLVSYFLQSEQIQTMVAITCVFDRDADQLVAAGGYVVQLLPEVTDPPLAAMHARLASFGDISQELAARDADPDWLLGALLAGEAWTRLAESEVSFACGCTRDKAVSAIAALGEADVRGMLQKGESVDVKCEYCREHFAIGPADFRRILGEPD